MVADDPGSSDSDDDAFGALSPIQRRRSSVSGSDDDDAGPPDAAARRTRTQVLDADEEEFDRRDDEDEIPGTTVWYGCDECSDFAPTLVEAEAWRHLLIGASPCPEWLSDMAQSTSTSLCRTARFCGRSA